MHIKDVTYKSSHVTRVNTSRHTCMRVAHLQAVQELVGAVFDDAEVRHHVAFRDTSAAHHARRQRALVAPDLVEY